MLATKNLSHTYTGGQTFNYPDINCKASDSLVILGQSGVGKSTLLHILAGILKPSKGEVIVGESSLFKLGANKLDSYRGQNIGLVFQKPHFVQSVSAKENLILAQRMAGRSVDKSRIDNLLQQLHIDHRSQAKTNKMSQGEQQRLSIARALVNSPKVILADEPTSALDDRNCEEVIQLLNTQAEAVGAALIIVTHDNRLKKFFTNHVELI